MAEGCEETESSSSNVESPAMLGTALPCEAITAALGGMKRELDIINTGIGGGSSGALTYPELPSTPAQHHSHSHLHSHHHQTQQPTVSVTVDSITSTSSPNDSIELMAAPKTMPVIPIKLKSNSLTISPVVSVDPENNRKKSSSLSPISLSDQSHRITLKTERIDDSSSHNYATPDITDDKTDQQHLQFYKNYPYNSSNRSTTSSSSPPPLATPALLQSSHHELVDSSRKKSENAVTAVQAHLNGTMQEIFNLQKLQHDKYQMHHQLCNSSNSRTALLSELHQELTGTTSAAVAAQAAATASAIASLNSPLNLSVGSSTNTKPKISTLNPLAITSDDKHLTDCQSPSDLQQMPQFILASGQIIEGVQGAQLLIPTSQGISVQTVLTIPVSQQICTNEQFGPNAAIGGDSLDFNHLQFAAHQQQLPHNHKTNLVKPNLFSIGVQKLLAALHPQLFPSDDLQLPDESTSPQHHLQHQQRQQHSPVPPTPTGGSQHHHHHHRPKSSNSGTNYMKVNKQDDNLINQSNSNNNNNNSNINNNNNNKSTSLSPKLDLQSIRQRLEPSANLTLSPTFHNPSSSGGGGGGGGHRGGSRSGDSTGNRHDDEDEDEDDDEDHDDSPKHRNSYRRNSFHEKPISRSTPPNCTISGSYTPTAPETSQVFQSHSSPNDYMNASSSVSSSSCHINSPSSTSLLNSINRLTNGELTITKSLNYPNHTITGEATTSSTSPKSAHPYNHHTTAMKLSPTFPKQQNSPPPSRSETVDLQLDSPNELTINQTNLNVVEGINLNEIKEFAKAFKLRRLSLGLTQTQVGQALSVTEGPAYSQSAICSALAAQMYAAQLSSQQQNMFEKLDITPKSAQKIKPVLERWMKEAEESHWNRFKTGQSHLTDFIGVEPSKKRKRRTSFTPQALELLNAHFERNTHPSGTEITGLAHQLGYEREVIRIWFCNKRQALKNTVRMMSKGMA